MTRKYKQRNSAWADKVRDKIKTAHLVDRLTRYAIGQPGPQGETIKLESGQIKAIEILLSKTLPALTSADITQHHEELRTAEEIRIELIRDYGEPLAMLLLKEITPVQYADMVKPKVEGKTGNADNVESKHGKVDKDVIPAHTQPQNTGPTKPEYLQ